MANCGQGEQEMPEALGSATFIWSTGPGAHQEMQTRQLGRLRVGSSPWPSASNETSFLVPVRALAGLLLTEESFDLRHPLCLAPAVPALDTAENADPSENQKAQDPPQHNDQELWPGLGETCRQNFSLGFQQDFVLVTQ